MLVKILRHFIILSCFLMRSLFCEQTETLQESEFETEQVTLPLPEESPSTPKKKSLREILENLSGELNVGNLEKEASQGQEESGNSLVNLDGCPSAMIAGVVNAITGDYCDFQRDFVVPGFEPIAIERSYCSSSRDHGALYDSWHLNHQAKVKIMPFGNYYPKLSLIGPLGEHLEYVGSRSKKNLYFALNRELFNQGLTNTGRGEMSGQTNVKNTHMIFDRKNKESCLLKTGAGTELSFEKTSKDKREEDVKQYHLMKQTLSNGNAYFYDYDEENLSAIVVGNINQDKFHSVSLSCEKIDKKNKIVSIRGSNGSSAKYHMSLSKTSFNKDLWGYYLTSVECSDAPPERYTYKKSYDRDVCNNRIVRKDRPHNRFIEIEYYPVPPLKQDLDSPEPRAYIEVKREVWENRVKCLRAPVGNDATPIVTHTFEYSSNRIGESKHFYGVTEVRDVNKTRTTYRYRDSRLVAIQRYHPNNESTYSIERFNWGAEGTVYRTNLMARLFEDGAKKIHFSKVYQYDGRGNITAKKLYGNLTGNYLKPLIVNAEGIPTNPDCECERKTFTYSSHERNLLLSETDAHCTKIYSYIPNRSLVQSCLIRANQEIKRRSFYEYDACGVLIKEISDDGSTPQEQDLSGVTERKIRYITPKITAPVGLPETIEEKYLNLTSGKEELLKKTVNQYDPQGRIVRQNQFDSLGILSLSLFWEYNAHGKITHEKNAQGHNFVRRYDANDNLIFEQGPNLDYYTEYAYDFCNRLTHIKETHADGQILQKRNLYKRTGKLQASTDFYGNATHFSYDQFGRVTEKMLPRVSDEEGNLIRPTIKTSYDWLGNPVTVTDPLGNVTKTAFNIRGQPYRVEYPDGSVESCEYTLDGGLKKNIAKDGTSTLYTRDYQGRILKQEQFSPTGELLTEQTFTYNAFHLLSQTDTNGLETFYTYDFAGRLIQVCKGEMCTSFEYDSRGNIIKTVEAYGDESHEVSVKAQKYDRYNRLIEERVEDSNQNVLRKTGYAYDLVGNRSQTITFTKAGKGIHTTAFNPHGEVVTVTDAEGHQSVTKISHTYYNAHDQRVPYYETTDPLGNISIRIGDSLGRIVCVMRKNALGQMTQKSDFFYDAAGNRIKMLETVLCKDKPDRQVATLWAYDCMNRLTELTEAAGTPEQKVTRILYNRYGQKETLIKADGVELSHVYDAWGRLVNFYASDNSFHYSYIYDANHDLVAVKDLKEKTETLKKYNKNHRLIEETLANGIKIRYLYDRLGRPKKIELPDDSSIAYTYNAAFLKTVERISAQNALLYTHTYKTHDLSGNIVEAQLINGQKYWSRTTLNGSKAYTMTSNWSEKHFLYDPVGNLIERQFSDKLSRVICKYAYDDLYQLQREEGTVTNEYEYDSLYNRTKKNGLSNVVNALNQLIKKGATLYHYTPSGCLFKKNRDQTSRDQTSTDYIHDALDRLISVTRGNLQVRYTYDELNRRLSKAHYTRSSILDKWTLQNRQRYLYIGQNEVGALDSSGKIVQLRVLGTSIGAEIGGAIAIELDEQVYAPIHDHSGNVTSLLNGSSDEVVATYRYSAFGEEQVFYTHEKIGNPWRFSSKRVDEETGFVYFGRRYYNPSNGRWTTPDPIGYEDGPNLYAYVKNSPLTHCDLYGLSFSETSKAITDTIYNSTRPLRELSCAIGGLVENIGKNWVPCPILNDVIEIAGRILGGKSSKDFIPSFERRSFWDRYDGKDFSNVIFVFASGMGVSYKEFREYMKAESELHGGATVIGHYKHDQGTFFNVLDAALQKMGVPTQSYRSYHRGIKGYTEEAIKTNKAIHATVHSHGSQLACFTGARLLKAQRDRIMLFTYGSPYLPSQDTFLRVSNNVASDGVTFFCDPIGAARALIWKDGKVQANFLESKGKALPFLDHSFNNETYRTAREGHAKNFNEEFNIK